MCEKEAKRRRVDIAPCRRREACPHASAVFGVISLDRGAMWASLPTGICGAMWASLPTRGNEIFI